MTSTTGGDPMTKQQLVDEYANIFARHAGGRMAIFARCRAA
jgi:hypothetical protein